jgi:ATP-dependent protease ClpP protease subunit
LHSLTGAGQANHQLCGREEKASGMTTPPQIVRFFAPVNPSTSVALIQAIDRARSKNSANVTLLLSTHGGDSDQGIAIYNYLRSLPNKITVVNMGVVASIATIIYCGCQRRLSVPHALFSFHPNSFNIVNEQLGLQKLQEKINQLTTEYRCLAHILADASRLTFTEAESLLSQCVSLSPKEAVERGIAHEIMDYSIPANAELQAIQ